MDDAVAVILAGVKLAAAAFVLVCVYAGIWLAIFHGGGKDK
jgi:hypothetical protein